MRLLDKHLGSPLKKNFTLSLTAQALSLMVSFVVGFFVPKCLDQFQYAYWQSFVLYVGYVGVLHFGLLDGLVLRYSEYDYDQLDKKVFKSQLFILTVLLIVCSVVTICVAIILFTNANRIVALFVAIGIISKNLYTFYLYIFQITNRIKNYTSTVILQRFTYMMVIMLLLLLRVNRFEFYCASELFGDIVAIIFGAIHNKEVLTAKRSSFVTAMHETKTNVLSGCILMFANWASMLLVGGAKMCIQWHWSTLVFGQVSFAFSLSNMFLGFISAMSVVLFPALKRTQQNQLPKMYISFRGKMSDFLLLIMILYWPGCKILEIWLPEYGESLKYLAILLPMIIFSSKVSMLTNNYLKVYRKEKSILKINCFSIIGALISYALAALVFDNIELVLIFTTLWIMVRSIISEAVVSRIIGCSYEKDSLLEIIMAAVFITTSTRFNALIGFLVYASALAIYFFMKYLRRHKHFC